jgi:single-stranded-DNA-specific exonuclease
MTPGSNRRIVRRTPLGHVAGAESLGTVIGRVLANRGLDSIDDLAFSNRDLLPPDGLGQVADAAGLIAGHVRRGSRIMIVGDYDADGATSVALSVLALRAMGAGHVDYLVPDRFKLGYGLSPALVDLAAERSPDLLIRVSAGRRGRASAPFRWSSPTITFPATPCRKRTPSSIRTFRATRSRASTSPV